MFENKSAWFCFCFSNFSNKMFWLMLTFGANGIFCKRYTKNIDEFNQLFDPTVCRHAYSQTP